MKTVHLTPASFQPALELWRSTEHEFKVTRTGYTCKVELMDGSRYFFGEHGASPRIFSVSKKMKDEVSKAEPIKIPGRIKYYRFQDAQERDTLPGAAFSIDLSAAYAYALLNLGLITEETLGALRSLPKKDRLRAVGMLAAAKDVFTYRNGKVEDIASERAETAWAFFAACHAVGELMDAAAGFPGFLFYWVDGAFFDQPSQEVSEYFSANGYPSKTEEVSNLKWSTSRKYLFFTKDGERKYLSIPEGKQPSAQWIAELLEKPTTTNP